ncbi:hypothetical protein RRF57_007292 [Xylaria bambusicola]|uniref:Uncharacterized protein n=1 Tax=Xylaria bambusicola TaxID=326684 RepID=A0AAN7URS2_9PEZI
MAQFPITPSSLPPRPPSPWAKRFHYNTGGRFPLVDDNEFHSGLAPQLPILHPKYHADTPPQESWDAFNPTKQQLDHCFTFESFQSYYLKGILSWEVGSLMRYVWFSDKIGVISGGHRKDDYGPVDPATAAGGGAAGSTKEDAALQIFHANRIQVDESKWYRFLKKDRWYDLDKPDPLLSGGNWSVDNPKVWEVLSISLELVDRMLKALVEDKNETIEMMLFGLMANWRQVFRTPEPIPNAYVILSRDLHRQVCTADKKKYALDHIPNTTKDWTSRFEALMKYQTFSFVDRHMDETSTWGLTMNNGLIALDVNPLRNLMSNDITLAERCILHYVVVVTLIHEMFHSSTKFRKLDVGWPKRLPSINWMPSQVDLEPFVDRDGAAEMGFAAEQRLFGGQFSLGPVNVNDLPLGAYRLTWPEPWNEGITIGGHRQFQKGVTIHLERVPALYASKLLSTAFWDDPNIPQKSIKNFHYNPIFISNTKYRGATGYWQGLELVRTQALHPLPSPLNLGEKEMVDFWHKRHEDWAQGRIGWFTRENTLWTDSSWGCIKQRLSILRFKRAFDRKDELRCRSIARNLTFLAKYDQGKDVYIESLATLVRNRNLWVYHAIGLLMFAALPIRRETREDTDMVPAYTTNFLPSIAATAAKRQPRALSVMERPRRSLKVPANILYDPLNRDRQGAIANFTQVGYLDCVDSLLFYLAKLGQPLSDPWICEISKISGDLRKQRRDIRRARDPNSWAVWNYATPAYDNTMSTYENGEWKVQP